DGIVLAEIARDRPLEFPVQIVGAADEAHARHAVAKALQRLLRGGYQLGVVGKAEIIVGAQIDNVAAAPADSYSRTLRRGDRPFHLVEIGGANLFKLGVDAGKKCSHQMTNS